MPSAADIMKAGDMKDVRIRREAFMSIAAFSRALDAFSDEVESESIYTYARVVETARAAAMYFSEDIRSEIDRALGPVDLLDELNEQLGERITFDRNDVERVAAMAILSSVLGLPKPREWPTCAEPGCEVKSRDVSWSPPGGGKGGLLCFAHYQMHAEAKKKAAAAAPDPTAEAPTNTPF